MGLDRIIARVQAHPSRSNLHGPLVEALGLPTEVCLHSSDPPNPWTGYVHCLSDLPLGASHVLVIQDDAQVCQNFGAVVQQIATDVPVCLFLAGFPQGTATKARRAWNAGQRYVVLYRSLIMPLVAVLWPRAKVEEFLAWAESGVTLVGHPTPRADDGIAGQWMRNTSQTILCTVPSIVQHRAELPSTKGVEAAFATAAIYEQDASKYDWSRSNVL